MKGRYGAEGEGAEAKKARGKKSKRRKEKAKENRKIATERATKVEKAETRLKKKLDKEWRSWREQNRD